MRSPSESPNTRMKSALETTGATIVCVHSFVTRTTSLLVRAMKPTLVELAAAAKAALRLRAALLRVRPECQRTRVDLVELDVARLLRLTGLLDHAPRLAV